MRLVLGFISKCTLIDPNDSLFVPLGGMPQRIHAYCIERGLTPPQSDGEFAFWILNSLAHGYKKTIDQTSAIIGRTIELIYILGGGSQIDLLNQLTADICKVIVKLCWLRQLCSGTSPCELSLLEQ